MNKHSGGVIKTDVIINKVHSSDDVSLKDFYSKNKSERETFHLKNVSEKFVLKELRQLNPCKSTGLDEIPARFLKGADFLKIPITFLKICQFLKTVYQML